MCSFARIRHICIIILTIIVLGLNACTVTKLTNADMRPTPSVTDPVVIDNSPVVTPHITSRLIAEARSWIGTRYVYGGQSRRGTDCSGLMLEVFKTACNVKLPRTAANQQKYCTAIKKRDLRPGDLVFFSSARTSSVTHVGLYVGGTRMIHASSSRGVIESSMNEPYFARHYHSAGRVPVRGATDRLAPDILPAEDLDIIIDEKIDSILNAEFGLISRIN